VQKRLFPIFVLILVAILVVGIAQRVMFNATAEAEIDATIDNLVVAAHAAANASTADEGARLVDEFVRTLWTTEDGVYGGRRSGYRARIAAVAAQLADLEFMTGTAPTAEKSTIRNRERVGALVDVTLARGEARRGFQLLLANSRGRDGKSTWFPVSLLEPEDGYDSAVHNHLFAGAGFLPLAYDRFARPGDPVAVRPPAALAAAITTAPVPATIALTQLPADAELARHFKPYSAAPTEAVEWSGPMSEEQRNALLAVYPDELPQSAAWENLVNSLYVHALWKSRTPGEDDFATFKRLRTVIAGIPAVDRARARGEIPQGIFDDRRHRILALQASLLDPLNVVAAELEEKWKGLNAEIKAVEIAEGGKDQLAAMKSHVASLLNYFDKRIEFAVGELAALGISPARTAGTAEWPGEFGEPLVMLKQASVFAEPDRFYKPSYKDYTAALIRVRFAASRKASFEVVVKSEFEKRRTRLSSLFGAVSNALTALAERKQNVHQLFEDVEKSGNIAMWVRERRIEQLDLVYRNENATRTQPDVDLGREMKALAADIASSANTGNREAIADFVRRNRGRVGLKSTPQEIIDELKARLADVSLGVTTDYMERARDQLGDKTITFEIAYEGPETRDEFRATWNGLISAANTAVKSADDEMQELAKKLGFPEIDADSELPVLRVTWQGVMTPHELDRMLTLLDNARWRAVIRALCKKTESEAPAYYDWFGFAGYEGELVDLIVLSLPTMTESGPRMQWVLGGIVDGLDDTKLRLELGREAVAEAGAMIDAYNATRSIRLPDAPALGLAADIRDYLASVSIEGEPKELLAVAQELTASLRDFAEAADAPEWLERVDDRLAELCAGNAAELAATATKVVLGKVAEAVDERLELARAEAQDAQQQVATLEAGAADAQTQPNAAAHAAKLARLKDVAAWAATMAEILADKAAVLDGAVATISARARDLGDPVEAATALATGMRELTNAFVTEVAADRDDAALASAYLAAVQAALDALGNVSADKLAIGAPRARKLARHQPILAWAAGREQADADTINRMERMLVQADEAMGIFAGLESAVAAAERLDDMRRGHGDVTTSSTPAEAWSRTLKRLSILKTLLRDTAAMKAYATHIKSGDAPGWIDVETGKVIPARVLVLTNAFEHRINAAVGDVNTLVGIAAEMKQLADAIIAVGPGAADEIEKQASALRSLISDALAAHKALSDAAAATGDDALVAGVTSLLAPLTELQPRLETFVADSADDADSAWAALTSELPTNETFIAAVESD
jgi:hypothetical protein